MNRYQAAARPPIEVERFLGLRYQPGGRERPAVDCWGLVRLVYLEAYGLELPLYELEGRISRAFVREHQAWRLVPERAAIAGDVVLAQRVGRPLHAGVLLPGGRILHCDQGCDVAMPRLDGPYCKDWTCSYWRQP